MRERAIQSSRGLTSFHNSDRNAPQTLFSGTTPYEQRSHRQYQQPLLEFPDAGAARRPGGQLSKHVNQWLESLCVGRESRTDEHLAESARRIVRRIGILTNESVRELATGNNNPDTVAFQSDQSFPLCASSAASDSHNSASSQQFTETSSQCN